MTIRLEKGSYQVMELLDFENPGKAPIVSKDGAPTIRIALPASSNVRNPEVEILSAPHGLDRKFLQLIGKENHLDGDDPPGAEAGRAPLPDGGRVRRNYGGKTHPLRDGQLRHLPREGGASSSARAP